MESTDIIIVGAGGVGLAASMYAARLGMKSIVFGYSHGSEFPIGGVITTTNIVENYPGFITLTGQEIAKKIEEHARAYDEVTIKTELIESVTKEGNYFIAKSKQGEYKAKAVIFATGTKWRKLEVEGSETFANKGVHYCALCDGAFYKGKIVAVVGGSDSAAKDALVLAEHAEKVYIIYRREQIRAEPINLKRIKDKGNIEIINNANITKINGEQFVTNVDLDREYNGSSNLKLDGVFVAIGHIVLSDLARSLGVKVDEKGEIVINHADSSTSEHGVFAAGDVTDKPFKQLITGVADGCTAAHSAYEYIRKNEL